MKANRTIHVEVKISNKPINLKHIVEEIVKEFKKGGEKPDGR